MRNALFAALAIALTACGISELRVPEPTGYDIPWRAQEVFLEGTNFDQVREAMVDEGFSLEDADRDAGFLRSAPQAATEGMMVRVTASEVSGGFVVRGDWMWDQESRRTVAAVRSGLTGRDWDTDPGEWKSAGWTDEGRDRLALLRVIDVAEAVSAPMELRR
ncbi:MAG: hypothetical protein RJQ04_04095 [Longimicrobiales bacterium]